LLSLIFPAEKLLLTTISNNQVIIIEQKKDFCIYENLCVDNDFFPTKENLIHTSKSLREAIKWAGNYCNEYPYVEYGYVIQLQDKVSKTGGTKV